MAIMPGSTGAQPEVTHPVSVIVLAVLSMLFQLVGFVTPGWLVQEYPETAPNMQLNLWYVVRCREDDCQSDVLEDVNNLDVTMKPYRVEASIALWTIIVAVGVAIHTRRKQANFRYNIMAYLSIGFLSLISGIVSLSSTGRFADAQNEAVKMSTGASPIRFPYSLLLTGLGGIIACFVVLSSVRMICHVSKIHERQAGNTQLNAGEQSMYPAGPIAYNQYQPAYVNPTFPPTQMGYLEPTAPQVYQQNATNEGKMQGIAPPPYQLTTGSSMPQ